MCPSSIWQFCGVLHTTNHHAKLFVHLFHGDFAWWNNSVWPLLILPLNTHTHKSFWQQLKYHKAIIINSLFHRQLFPPKPCMHQLLILVTLACTTHLYHQFMLARRRLDLLLLMLMNFWLSITARPFLFRSTDHFQYLYPIYNLRLPRNGKEV